MYFAWGRAGFTLRSCLLSYGYSLGGFRRRGVYAPIFSAQWNILWVSASWERFSHDRVRANYRGSFQLTWWYSVRSGCVSVVSCFPRRVERVERNRGGPFLLIPFRLSFRGCLHLGGSWYRHVLLPSRLHIFLAMTSFLAMSSSWRRRGCWMG